MSKLPSTPDQASDVSPGFDSVEGYVDTLTATFSSGWAWLPNAPHEAVSLEVVEGSELIATGVANLERPDLREAGKGTGLYGFRITFDKPLAGGMPVVFRRTSHPNQQLVVNVPLPTGGALSSAGESAKEPSISDWGIQGSIDWLSRSGAVGWAWTPDAPGESVLVEAVLDGRVIGSVRATEFRQDLADAGLGTGCYGFSMQFDEVVLDNPPEFRGLRRIGEVQNKHQLPPLDPKTKIPTRRGSMVNLLQDHSRFTVAGPEFEEFDESILQAPLTLPKLDSPLVMAFYLPQFHPIPENDEFWGRGFTEWRQLARGLPRYPGHYQPRIPRDLGFYNLVGTDTLQAQAAVAKAAGVNCFAYYYYWFNGRRVLEKPLDQHLTSSSDMPLLIIWANENWTRTWDGAEKAVLLRQDYRPEDEVALLDDLARHFLDRRYVRLDGRPLFIIYNPRHIPDAADTIARWRKVLRSRHDVDPLIFMAQTFGERDPAQFGLDGALEFPPHKLSDTLPGRPTPDAYSPDFTGRVIDYDDFIKVSVSEPEVAYPLIKTAVPSWDNDVRRPNRGLSLEGATPKKFQDWLHTLLEKAIAKPIYGRAIVAINAWNEWAEGAYLEPDVYYGAAYLNATARAIVGAMQKGTAGPVASRRLPLPAVSVIFPNYNHERFIEERIRSVLAQTCKPDEIIFLDDCSSDNSVELAEKLLAEAQIPYRVVKNEKNSGSVFRQWLKGLELARNSLVWICETDDSVDPRFLEHLLPYMQRSGVVAAFGHIRYIDENGECSSDLDGYFDSLENFSWSNSSVVAAYKAFCRDFVIRNVVPNASGLVFRKPVLTEEEKQRLFSYRFAGDWFFYSLLLRGGALAYVELAKSYFRFVRSSASRTAFFTDRHIEEHQMILDDLTLQYDVAPEAIQEHIESLLTYFPEHERQALTERLSPPAQRTTPRRVCIAAHGFMVGGGEILPVELANILKARGLHVTFLSMEQDLADGSKSIRGRLRPDIGVVFWDDIRSDFSRFVKDYGIEIINSHNVSVESGLFWQDTWPDVGYVGSLHGGYETVPDCMTAEFGQWLNLTVDRWLFLAEKNVAPLTSVGVPGDRFVRSFNAVPAVAEPVVDRSEFRRMHRIEEESFTLVLCSRAIPEKGWQVAIDAVQIVRILTGRDISLVLIGAGPAATELKHTYGDVNWLKFLGHVDNPARFFSCFDLGIFPSTFSGETFPLFLLECFQSGLPVIATDIGEIPRIVGTDPGEAAGLLLSHTMSRYDLTYAVADALVAVSSDPSTYAKMRENAAKASDRFSMGKLADLYIDTFESVLAVRSSADLTKAMQAAQ